ncbi:MAG: sialidase family protein [Gemmatimonadaceae bacterium]
MKRILRSCEHVPLVLHHVLRRSTVRVIGIVASCTLVLLTFGAGSAAGQGTSRITVGSNVQVSKAWSDREHTETILATNPRDANHLLASAMVLDPVLSAYYILVYVSFDGGRTWTQTLEVRRGLLAGDPSLAFGTKGEAYVVCLGFPLGPDGSAGGETLVYRSPDGGKSWEAPTSLPMSDRPHLAVDHTGGAYSGRLYLHTFGGPGLPDASIAPFDSGGPIGFALSVYRSTDGATFPAPTQLVFQEKRPLRRIGTSVVLSDGTFMAVVGQVTPGDSGAASRPGMVLKTVTSSDGGENFSPANTVSSWSYPTNLRVFATNPAIAVDASNGPFRDRVYVVWADGREGRSKILLSYSDNKGHTWSPPVAVDDAPAHGSSDGPNAFQPAVAVNNAGVVGVVWYDRRDHPNDVDWTEYFAASTDGGETFLPNVRISERPFLHDWTKPATLSANLNGVEPPNGASGALAFSVMSGRAYTGAGETQGLAASADGAFHPLWIDNRTGVPQMWIARVTVNGRATRSGRVASAKPATSPTDSSQARGPVDASKEIDVTRDVGMELTSPKYDPATRIVSVEARLVNRSSRLLTAPLRVVVLAATSALGPVQIVGAGDGVIPPEGVPLDFTAQLPAGGLQPGKTTAARRLEFRVGQRPSPARASVNLNALSVHTRVFARVQ